MSVPDFRELHHELTDEFFYYADQKGRVMGGSWLDELKSMYWRPRSVDYMVAAANLPGSKLLLTVDDAAELPMLVRKGLMVADHVIIRHNRHLPITGMSVEVIPFNSGVVLGLPKWVESNRDKLREVVALPHYGSTPSHETIGPFVRWLSEDGREWFRRGFVSYVPALIPGEVEVAMFAQGINLSPLFRHASIVPHDHGLVDIRAVAALAEIQIPHIHNVSAELLHAFREEERDATHRFRDRLILLLNEVAGEIGSPEFSASVSQRGVELNEQVREVRALIEKHAKTRLWRRLQTELLTLSAAVFFYAGVPAAALTALTAAAVDLAKSSKEGLEEQFSIREHPAYVLARVGEISKADSQSVGVRVT
jgi:hypothetical protein